LMYQKADYLTAIEMIRSGAVNLDPLITTHFSFPDYARAYKYIEEYGDHSMKVLIDF
jgi:L-iditol 2-dehydrogenase